ncbi:hypothetical protein J6590_078175 [Homalodisca vitripennis]|nr:hypothetical protein J6590_078175 [Homalodisca vitripennis]
MKNKDRGSCYFSTHKDHHLAPVRSRKCLSSGLLRERKQFLTQQKYFYHSAILIC